MDSLINVDDIISNIYQPTIESIEKKITHIAPKTAATAITKSQSGFNIELFIDSEAANKYLCSICHHVVSDCRETTCGHIFCGGCINRILFDNREGFKCPCCNQINSQRPHQSIYLNRAVKNLRVKCPFHINGCVWIGALSDLMVSNSSHLSHLMNCEFAPITCDECNNRICRAEFDIHRKQCLKLCVHCNLTFNSTNDRKLHYQKCPILVQCKHCKQKIKKTQLNHHISFLCCFRVIKCPFYHFGCHEVIKSLNLTNHLKYNAAQHYQLKVDHCINKIEKMKIKIDSLLKINNDTNIKQNVLQKQNESLSKQLVEIKNKMKLQQMYNHKPCPPIKNANAEPSSTPSPSLPLPLPLPSPSTSPSPPPSSSSCIPRNGNSSGNSNTTACPDILFLFGTNKWEETGVFIRRSVLHEDRVCYTSLRTKCAIRWNEGLNAWMIDRRGLASDNEASLIAYQDVLHPGLVTNNWLVYNDDCEEWQQSTNYRIQSYNLAEFIFKADKIFASCSNHKLLNINSKLTTNDNNNKENINDNNKDRKDNNKSPLHKGHPPPGLLVKTGNRY